MKTLLTYPKRGIRKEACWTISNITAGPNEQIQMVIEQDIIPILVDILRSSEVDIRKEAAWAISNATSGGTARQAEYLVNQGVIPPLCALFDNSDPSVVQVALEGIENILRFGQEEATNHNGVNPYVQYVEQCHGPVALQRLQEHSNDAIFEKVKKILKQYFGAVDEENPDDTAGPAQPQHQAQQQQLPMPNINVYNQPPQPPQQQQQMQQPQGQGLFNFGGLNTMGTGFYNNNQNR